MAKLSIFLLSLLCLVSPVISSYLTNKIYQWTKNAESYTSAGKWLQNHQFFFTSKVMVTQCAYECLKRPTCKSFNFDRGEEKCQLNRKTHEQSPTDYVNASLGKEYHTRDAYSIDQEALGPCAGDPCSGKGRCLETKTTAEDLIAICLCEKGWTGSKCHLQAQVPEWGAWQDWGDCSVTCDRGWRVRKRNCEDTANSKTLDPLECYGHDVEYGACVKQECPRWREWGEWGTCSKYKSCGRGFKVRHRLCTNGGTPGVDRYCLGPTNETAPCYDIDCRGPLRLRGGSKHGEGRVEVFNDKRNEWGLVCADQWTMFAANLTCKQIGLPGAFAPVTDGRFSSGGMKYGITSLTCNQSERTLQMCERNPWSLANSCSGSTKSAGVQCQVNGVWSLWNSWGDCSVTCENGIRQRTRQCNHPPALHGGKPCVGDSVQSKPCTLSACPSNGTWFEWGLWGPCGVTCGTGEQTRQRDCDNSTSTDWCVGSATETQSCDAGSCAGNATTTPQLTTLP